MNPILRQVIARQAVLAERADYIVARIEDGGEDSRIGSPADVELGLILDEMRHLRELILQLELVALARSFEASEAARRV